MKPLKVCPDCGAYLDSDERCDCKDTDSREAEPETAENPRGPVLDAGA